jgi:hypothetical protein
MVDESISVFLWRSFEKVGKPTDAEEAGEMRWVPLGNIPELIADRQILGAGTLVALLQLLALSRGVEFRPSSA